MTGQPKNEFRRLLCRLEDIADGKARGFMSTSEELRSVFAIRRGEKAFVYVNECPHAGAELEFAQDRFLSADGERIICFAHNAQFAVETGTCVAGPCAGQVLQAVPVDIVNGEVMIPADAGKID